MNLNEIRNRLNYIIGLKTSSNNLLTPERFDDLIRDSSLKHFKAKVGLPEEYQPGAPVPREAYEITQRISNDLKPFKVVMGEGDIGALSIDSDGMAIPPSDLYYPSYLIYRRRVNNRLYPVIVDIVTDLEWANCVNSIIKEPEYTQPIANFQPGYIRFMPKGLRYTEFAYLKYPKEPHFAYTSIDGYIKYDASNSTELEWDNINIVEIISLALKDIGISIKANEVLAYADQEIKTGT